MDELLQRTRHQLLAAVSKRLLKCAIDLDEVPLTACDRHHIKRQIVEPINIDPRLCELALRTHLLAHIPRDRRYANHVPPRSRIGETERHINQRAVLVTADGVEVVHLTVFGHVVKQPRELIGLPPGQE